MDRKRKESKTQSNATCSIRSEQCRPQRLKAQRRNSGEGGARAGKLGSEISSSGLTNLERAHHLGAIARRLIGHAPVLVARADVISTAGTMARAGVGANGRGRADKRKREHSLEHRAELRFLLWMLRLWKVPFTVLRYSGLYSF